MTIPATTEIVREETPNAMISLALANKADPEVLARLMDLQERWEKNDARKDFMEALAEFKRKSPAVLAKDETVDFATAKGRTNYRYAGLGGIVRQITVILSDCGLNASWETHQDKDTVAVTCHVTHVKGHRESTTLSGPLDNSGNKNLIQQLGSTVTYLQRYTLLALLGLATSEQDDDASGGKKGNDHPPAQRRESAKPAAAEAPPAQSDSGGERLASEKQRKMLYAKAKSGGLTDEKLHEIVKEVGGVDSSRNLPASKVDAIVAAIAAAVAEVESIIDCEDDIFPKS
jgi:hypothetical protein